MLTIRRIVAMWLLSLAAVFALSPGVSGAAGQVPASTNAATPDAVLTVRNVACPAGTEPDSLADQCRTHGLGGIEFVVDGTTGEGVSVHRAAATAGGSGEVTFNLPAGDYTIAQAVMTGDFASYKVSCATGDSIQLPVEYRGNGRAAVALTLGAGQQVFCDWYNIPAATGDASQVVVPEAAVQRLPDAGSGPDRAIGGRSARPWVDFALIGGALLVAGVALVARWGLGGRHHGG